MPTALTPTAENARRRLARREVWWKAEALTDYLETFLKFLDALGRAQRNGVEQALDRSEVTFEARWTIIESYREALGKQLLTPAHDMGSVDWKRRKLKDSSFNYIGVTKEMVEKTIADDVAFLEAHPTKHSLAGKSRAHKGEA